MTPDSRIRIAGILLLFLLAADTSFAQNFSASDVAKGISLEDPKYNGITVATVGSRKITAQEFLMSYAFGPAFTKREKDSRRRYLNFMIDEKLLALDGYARHLDAGDQASRTLGEIEGDLATEELYKDDVLKKVKVPESEIRQGMKMDRLHSTVHWLYAASKDECRNLEASLNNGIPFDSLYRQQFKDSVKEDDRSMETTPFRCIIKNPDLAKVIDTLQKGKYSRPVPAPDGYYIVEVSDRWTNPVISETEETKLHSDIQRALIQYKSDSLSDLYIQHLLVDSHPTIIRKPLDILHTYLAKMALPDAKFTNWKLDQRLLERWGPVNYSDITRYEKQSLVEMTGRAFTVGDFLHWYNARQYNLKLNDASPQAFFSSLEQMVWQMVRDRLLVDRAMKRGLQKREIVRKQTAWWKDKIVYKLAKGDIADSISITDSLLSKYYSLHTTNYRNEQGGSVPFEKVKNDVEKDYYGDALTERMLHRIIALKQKYKVEILEKNLESLELEQENDPKAIDVYVVKKGGTFPRQAFPSIDYEWQTWN